MVKTVLTEDNVWSPSS